MTAVPGTLWPNDGPRSRGNHGEVKGGTVELEGGRWLQNRDVMHRAPLEQGREFAGRLADYVGNIVHAKVSFGVGCMFPETDRHARLRR